MLPPEDERTAFIQPDPQDGASRVASSGLPRQLGKFPLLEFIGDGSIGVVYRSLDPDTRRDVAIRVIPLKLWPPTGVPSISQFRIAVRRFSVLSHPGIVRIRAYGEEAGFAYLVMDWISGRSLQSHFEQQVRFNIEQVIDIQSQLLQALGYVHERGLCHENLTPARVLITTNGRVRIKGFKLAGAGNQHGDIRAAGAVFYQLLCGMPPCTTTPDQPMPLPSEVSQQSSLRSFDALALQVLSLDPAVCLPSAAQFLERLLRAHA